MPRVVGSVTAFLLFALATASSPAKDPNPEVIVRFRTADSSALAKKPDALVSSLGAVMKQKIVDHNDIALVSVPAGMTLDAFLDSLHQESDILYAEPNVEVLIPEPDYAADAEEAFARNFSGPSDPYLTWGYSDIAADQVASEPPNGPMVAVVDTGVDYSHPELAGKIVLGPDLHNGDNDPMDDHGHGTHVAGIVAAESNNGIGSAGISTTSRILAIKVLSSSGSGSTWNVVQGVYAAADNPDVVAINLSLGTQVGTITFLDAIRYAAETKGKVVVAAAGNAGNDIAFFPAYWSKDVPGVVGVAANDIFRCRASFSNYGPNATVAAPGVSIMSTLPNGAYGAWSGTSMAAPFVAAAAARVLANSPGLTNTEILYQIQNSGDPLDFDGDCWPQSSYLFQHLDLAKALDTGSPDEDDVPPQITILTPTDDPTYETGQSEIVLSGTASDDLGVSEISWSTNQGWDGFAIGTTSWEVPTIPMYEGENIVTVTAHDSAGNTTSATLQVFKKSETGDILTIQVSSGLDDVNEDLRSGRQYTDRRRAYVGKSYLTGYRFAQFPVPSGATITDARLLQYAASGLKADITVVYRAEADDDSAPFSGNLNGLTNREKTAAAVSDHPGPWSQDYYASPDLKTIVQEVVDRAGWQSGNALTLFVEDYGSSSRRKVANFEYDSELAPVLEVTYQLPQ
jgi:thermitase